MTDRFSLISLPHLLKMILDQYDKEKSIFGIPEELFFKPDKNDKFRITRFGKLLENPVGVAAGPHSQLAQNIVASWLTGARFIELKTIQTLDELDISKPCIDMQDEGYNCEWSQELKISESYDQYLNAWIIIHILKDKLKIGSQEEEGFIFNMSVGYNLEGILQENVQWFFRKMSDASIELQLKIELLKDIYPDIVRLKISSILSDNITLSTMHGCPANEIEQIGEYLITKKHIHTAIKLNPTLLGEYELSEIMRKSGFETNIPKEAFEHDLKYDDSINIIINLQKKADKAGLQFSVKLTNTLESKNHKDVFSANEEMMYMSGRALHPISIKLAHKLQVEFNGGLDVSFSGGVNAFNIADVISCGLYPATVCTDLLKPGGYGRFSQYFENLRNRDVIFTTNESLSNLNDYSEQIADDINYKKTEFIDPGIKTRRSLNFFDCIAAPCVDTCPTNQGIPGYMYYTAQGEFEKAAEVIISTNPFPNTTGMVCDHICQTKCTRLNYDSPLLIREIKRFVTENYMSSIKPQHKVSGIKRTVAIIGAGPSGLSCAYFLAKAGFEVKVYETKPVSGGMVSGAIPSFRLTDNAYMQDLERIKKVGVEVLYNYNIDKELFGQLRRENDFVYIATGAQKSKLLSIKGISAEDVLDPLEFLFNVKKNKPHGLGKNVLIIGGGNTAMDAARTAYRLVGDNGKVRIVYRRTIKQMPADLGEIRAVLEEGVEILELTDPIEGTHKKDGTYSIICRKMELKEKDESGRARPMPVQGSEFELFADTIIPAIGQDLDIDFADEDDLKVLSGYRTTMDNVYIGGDALRGASTAINAIGDGRKVAQEIIDAANENFNTRQKFQRPAKSFRNHIVDKSKRIIPQKIKETSIDDRRNFKLVTAALTQQEAILEASRCLLCDEVCNICTTLCPNLALKSYTIVPLSYQLKKIIQRNGVLNVIDTETYFVEQDIQIIHYADWCNQCGNCTTFCPSSGSPYLDKPHLFFSKESFNNADDGFYYDEINEELSGKFTGKKYILKEFEDTFRFNNSEVEVELSKFDLNIIRINSKVENDYEIDLRNAAIMTVIFQGLV